MATKKQKIKVGVFLAINIIIFAALLALVAGFRGGDRVPYTIIFEGGVLGLNEGSLVNYKGFEVGRVDDIFLGDDQRVHARALIDPNEVTIYKGVDATLEIYSLATGSMTLTLSGGDPSQGVHPPEEPIVATPGLVESVGNQVAEAMDQMSQILKKVDTALLGLEEGALGSAINELDATVGETRKLAEDLRGFLSRTEEDFDQVATSFTEGVESIKGGVESLKAGVEDIRGFSASAGETVATVQEKVAPIDLEGVIDDLSSEVQSLSEEVQNVAASIGKASERVSYQSENVQYTLVESLERMNQVLTSVQDLADYLRENPASLVRGRK